MIGPIAVAPLGPAQPSLAVKSENEDVAHERSGSAESPPLGRLYDVDGRRLWLHRAGDGQPAVVVLAGAGMVGRDYLNVQERAAKLTTSVLYDRSGTGWSDDAQPDRSAAATTDELRSLLSVAAIPPPYVLVGHSLGGLFARRYAQRFPGEVAGLVLLDPAHEDFSAYMPQAPTRRGARGWMMRVVSGLSGRALGAAVQIAPGIVQRVPVVKRYRELYRRLFTAAMGDWPTPLRDDLVQHHVSLEWLLTGMREAETAGRLYGETRAGGPTPDVPMIILCSMAIDDFRRAVSVGESEALVAEELVAKRRLYDDLAATVPRGEVRAVDAGHLTIHFRHPEAVERAIADVLGR